MRNLKANTCKENFSVGFSPTPPTIMLLRPQGCAGLLRQVKQPPRGLRSLAALAPRQGVQHLLQGPQGWSGCLRQAEQPRGRHLTTAEIPGPSLEYGQKELKMELKLHVQFKETPRENAFLFHLLGNHSANYRISLWDLPTSPLYADNSAFLIPKLL